MSASHEQGALGASLSDPMTQPQEQGASAARIDHEFKSHPDVFWPAARGEKPFEYRRDDRGGYDVGQTVRLHCYSPDGGYLPFEPLDRRITNILRGGEFELPKGYCILGLAPLGGESGIASAGLISEIKSMFDRAVEEDGRLYDAEASVDALRDAVVGRLSRHAALASPADSAEMTAGEGLAEECRAAARAGYSPHLNRLFTRLADHLEAVPAPATPPGVRDRWLDWRGTVEGYEQSKKVAAQAVRQTPYDDDTSAEAIATSVCWMLGLDRLWQHVEALRTALAEKQAPAVAVALREEARRLHEKADALSAHPAGQSEGCDWCLSLAGKRDPHRSCAKCAPSKPRDTHPAGQSTGLGAETLDDRLRAAGMFTVGEMLGETPLTRWEVHAGMTDLSVFDQWLDRKAQEYVRLGARYHIGDKPKDDELYEWVHAHSSAFRVIRANFKAALSGHIAAQKPAPDSTRTGPAELRAEMVKALDGHTQWSRDCHLSGEFLCGRVWPLVEAAIADRTGPEALVDLDKHIGWATAGPLTITHSKLAEWREAFAARPAAPEGYRLISAEMAPPVMERMAFNLSAEFGPDFVMANKAFALAVYAEAYASGVCPAVPEAQGAERVRHVKRGTEYEVLGEAEAQVSVGQTVYANVPEGAYVFREVKDGDNLTVYRGSDGKLWCRFTDEFRDGRFEPAPSSDQGGR